MKKLILTAALILVVGTAFSQTLQKGNFLALHVITLNLDPDVTYNQWKNIVLNKWVPAFNEQFQGDVEFYLAEVDRGDDENGLSFLYIFKTVEVREKYFTQEGQPTELWSSKFENASQAIEDERVKLGITAYSGKHYNDWVIQ